MVQQKPKPELCDLKIEPLSGVDVNNAAAKLQSRGDVSDNQIFEILPRFSVSAGAANENWDNQYLRRREDVQSATGGKGSDVTGIFVGCELLAFERDKDELSHQKHFNSFVDFIVWRRSILLIGLSSSEIILADPSSYSVIHTWIPIPKLEGGKRFYVDAFIHSTPDPSKIDVVVVCQNGLVCTFNEVALSSGSLDATQDQNASVDVDLGSINDFAKQSLSISSNIACVCSPSRNQLIVVEESGNLLIVDLKDENANNVFCMYNILYDAGSPSTKLIDIPKKVAAFEGSLFLLLSSGTLKMFLEEDSTSKETLTFPSPASHVHDFALVRNDNELTVKLWVLYSVTTGSKVENFLGIFGGTMFSLEFNFQLPIYNATAEHSYYQFPKNISLYEEPSTIVEMAPNEVIIYHILETTTDVTLQKLLSRGKYLEAKELALNYQKDLDIVRKAEARSKLNALLAATPPDDLKQDSAFESLLQILCEICDAEFVCNFCVQAKLQKMDWIKQILNLGKSRVSNCSGTLAATKLLVTLKKLYTFELVCPGGSIHDWESFTSTENTMFLQSRKFLQNSNYDKCERVWKRHWDEFIEGISLKDFLPFFNVLFNHQLKTSESVSLLKTILPFAVDKLASVQSSPDKLQVKELDILFGIIQHQVSTLEGKIEWPINALSFIQKLISVVRDEIKRLDNSRNEEQSVLMKKKAIVVQLCRQLEHLEQILVELAELKRNHSIRILFHDYTNNGIPEVISKLLYKLLSKDEVEHFVANYLHPYAKRKDLSIDVLFSEHIKSVLQVTHYYLQKVSIPHEERITCLVDLISSMKIKLDCCLLISQEWPVPWTPGIAGMVDKILSMSRSSLDPECALIYDSIQTMKKQVPFRCVVNKYKLNSTKLLSRRIYVTMALFKILKLKKPGYLLDCQELLKHVPAKTVTEEVHLNYIEFVLGMYTQEISEEDVVPENLQTVRDLKRAILPRAFLELQNMETDNSFDLYTEDEQKRILKICTILAHDSKDPRSIMLCKLKEFIPEVPLDVIYNDDFPYSCLDNIDAFPSWLKDPSLLINDCKKLSRLTQTYLPDILVVVGAFFVKGGLPGNPTAVVWSIVEYIVNTPLNLDMSNTAQNKIYLGTSALSIAAYLVNLCPELSMENMNHLQDFLCRLSLSFEETNIFDLLSFFRIFQSLKEQEIPLENEFLEIYKWAQSGAGEWNLLLPKLKLMGETLYKFGESDLCNQILKSLSRQFRTVAAHFEDSENVTAANYYHSCIEDIENIKQNLDFQPLPDESCDHRMQNLVKDLNEAGIRVNVYALRLRDKLKLLERLLKQKAYTLAAELAIIFKFYDNHLIWSQILEGLASSENLVDLREVLESVSTVPQLWMLTEFADGWKKVSEVDPAFRDLCPIPL